MEQLAHTNTLRLQPYLFLLTTCKHVTIFIYIWFVLFVDPTPETEARKSLLANVRVKNERISKEGRRIVSEKEWDLLQQQVTLTGLLFILAVTLHTLHEH